MSSAFALRAYYLISFASMGIFLPFVSPWLMTIGIHGAALGWIAATRPLSGIVAPVLFGWLADTLGLRGKIVRIACLGALVPFLWLTFRTVVGAVPSAIELWLTIGISSFFRVPMMTLADVQALERSSGYGSSRVWGSIGFMLATLIAGACLAPNTSWQFPFAVAIAFLFAFALSFSFPPRISTPHRPTTSDVVELLRRPSYAVLLGVTAIWATAHVAYDLCISLHMRDLGATPLGTSVGWTLGAVPEIAFIFVWDRIKARFRLEHWLLFGLVATGLRFIALSLAGSLTVVFLLQPLHALSFAVVWMALMDLTRKHAPAGLLATAQGLFSTSCSVGATIGMVAFGAAYGAWGGNTSFGIAAVVAVCAAGVYFFAPFVSGARDSDRTLETAE